MWILWKEEGSDENQRSIGYKKKPPKKGSDEIDEECPRTKSSKKIQEKSRIQVFSIQSEKYTNRYDGKCPENKYDYSEFLYHRT